MKLKEFLFATVFLINIYSCDLSLYANNYDFKTTAIYVAPISEVTAFISTTGYVPKDADIGDAEKAHIDAKIIFSKNPYDTIRITSNGYKILTVQMNKQSRPIIDSSNYVGTILNCATLNPSNKVDSSELDELVSAILHTGAGPKGTYLKGQTNFITVDTVHFTTVDK